VTTEHQQLTRARELILNKQFDAARAILSNLPDNATAQQWLAKLDEIAPRVTSERPIQPLPPDPPFNPVEPSSALTQQTVSLTFNVTLTRYVVAGLVAAMPC
jgi:thioredoxin-like negative regulator of GroEL